MTRTITDFEMDSQKRICTIEAAINKALWQQSLDDTAVTYEELLCAISRCMTTWCSKNWRADFDPEP